MSETNSDEQLATTSKKPEPEAPDVNEAANPVLARLIDEVRNESAKGETTYDRVHNRHNR